MGLNEWIYESKKEVTEFGISGARGAFSKLMVGGAKRLGQSVNYGTSQFEQDWDVLILLDSCRPDYLRQVHQEADLNWVEEIDTQYSPASSSIEWVNKCLKTLHPGEKEGLSIVSGNGWTERELDESEFHSVETLLQTYWDEERGILPPEVVTNHAINRWRDDNPDRMLVWYMQPHTPHPSINVEYEFDTDMRGVTDDWTETEYARVGVLSDEELRSGYKATLKLGLEEVEVLAANLEAENVYLSADHAELLGEWGLYEHPRWAPIPRLKRVPWVKVDAEDNQTRIPKAMDEHENESDLDDRLRALGYKA
ncbi:hypothetical protein [Haloterrigena salifodinae]|uniref:hypothetical protein n=1 Tax=Haloterrigena salifodinae TaxID=2675099 RepID=UPI000F88A195|nr:hypothetical protein [Haloterrigena salifodinae]